MCDPPAAGAETVGEGLQPESARGQGRPGCLPAAGCAALSQLRDGAERALPAGAEQRWGSGPQLAPAVMRCGPLLCG